MSFTNNYTLMRNLKCSLTKTISNLLTSICTENGTRKQNNPLLEPFIVAKTNTTIKTYLSHLAKYCQFEPPTLIAMLILIDRLCKTHSFRLNFSNVHKIILSSLVISIKFNEDEYFDNKFYAEVGGVTLNELNDLEYYFLKLIDFKVYIEEAEYCRYYKNLIHVIELNRKVC